MLLGVFILLLLFAVFVAPFLWALGCWVYMKCQAASMRRAFRDASRKPADDSLYNRIREVSASVEESRERWERFDREHFQ